MVLISYLCGFFTILILGSLPSICACGTFSQLGCDAQISATTRDLVVELIAPIVAIGVESPEENVAEGDQGTFRILRNASVGDLRVNFLIGGNAIFDSDYIVQGADIIAPGKATMIIPDGRYFVKVMVDILDDVHAEAEEAITLTLCETTSYTINTALADAKVTIPQNDFAVITVEDGGEGSLRQAILNANALYGPNTITFDSKVGPFATPQTIILKTGLPDLMEELIIDGYIEGRLWLPTGVRVSGGNQHRVFTVATGARVTIRSLTIENGYPRDGGGILNKGYLIVNSVTFRDNTAVHNGGGLSNLSDTVKVINSTFANNEAGDSGGGLADESGKVTVINCTLSGNKAKNGGGLFSTGTLLLSNTILANSIASEDCMANGLLDPASTNNLIESNKGCGEPICTADPLLVKLGGYNGPTPTFPMGGGSPAINLGDNASATDENAKPLKWDQRGNGDPRFVGGITDIGAFEHQAFPSLVVDTFEDTDLRACTRSGPADCSLRGAIILANATGQPDIIRFDPRVFRIPQNIILTRPLPELVTDMTIDSSGTAEVTVSGNGRFKVFSIFPGTDVRLIDIRIDKDMSLKKAYRPCGGCLLPFPLVKSISSYMENQDCYKTDK